MFYEKVSSGEKKSEYSIEAPVSASEVVCSDAGTPLKVQTVTRSDDWGRYRAGVSQSQ